MNNKRQLTCHEQDPTAEKAASLWAGEGEEDYVVQQATLSSISDSC